MILILGKLSSCRRDPLIKPGPGGRAVIDPIANKEKALVEAFSMHFETSRRCVDGSTGGGGEQELDGGWPMFITRGYRGSANIKRLKITD